MKNSLITTEAKDSDGQNQKIGNNHNSKENTDKADKAK